MLAQASHTLLSINDMDYLQVAAAPAALAAVFWGLWVSRKRYKIDKQGRYVVLDLERPRLPLSLTLMNVFGSFFSPAKLDAEALIQKACKETGLSDFGDEDRFPFRDGLEKILSEVNACSALTTLGRAALTGSIVETLSNRLKQEDLIKRHPEILDEVIAAPVFVVGLARSGTTHMHRCLAQMEEFRGLKLYEALFPTMSEEVLKGLGGGVDMRQKTCMEMMKRYRKMRPLQSAMHPTGPSEFEEHIHLLGGVFRSVLFIIRFPCEKYLEWYQTVDPTVEYEYLRRCLQIIQWQSAQLGVPRKPFVLKNTTDISKLPQLKKCFPDARIFHTHRPVEKSVLSGMFLIQYSRGLMCQEDSESVRKGYVDFIERGLRNVDWDGWGDSAFHVEFDDFVRDNVGTLKEGCKAVGLEISEKSWENVEKYIKEAKRDKDGRVHYDASVFGTTEEELKERFKFFSIHGSVHVNKQ